MQKTGKCKYQCFCYNKTAKISPKTGPKTKKSASKLGPQKKMLQKKKSGQKVVKYGVFARFPCRFWTGAFTNRFPPYRFLLCCLKAIVTTYQKHEGFRRKMSPPPGKPVTFYKCHPEDHAPAPSVRADLD